jgi:hypothetical protein
MRLAVPCPACQQRNAVIRRFCRCCGARLGCPHCGSVNDPEDRFCGGCGHSPEQGQSPMSAPALAAATASTAGPAAEAGAPASPQVLGFDLAEVMREARYGDGAEITPMGGHPIHMEQAELDQLFDQ